MKRTRRNGLKRFHNGKDRYPSRPLGKQKTKSNRETLRYEIIHCCESQKAIDEKNATMLTELKNIRLDRVWDELTATWVVEKMPSWFSRKHKKHMGHFSLFLDQKR